MASERIINVDDDSFEENVLRSEVPVLVDFWAAWCGPCRAVAPVLEQLAEEMDGKVRIAKLDIDANVGTAYKFSVMSVPTFILFKNGQVADKMTGAMPKSAFQRFFDRNL